MKLLKSFLWISGFALCAMLMACNTELNSDNNLPDDKKQSEEKEKTDVYPDKIIWEPKSTEEGTFITVSGDAWENDGHLKSDFTGKAPIIYFEDGIDLTGYKYLNIEAYCPDDGYHLIGFTGFSEEPNEKVARLQVFGSKDATVYQTNFGVNNNEWPDMSTGTFRLMPSTSNKINYILTYSFDPLNPVGDIPDVRICIKKIYVTNQKLTNDTSKDKTVFKAIEPEGHKFTTQEYDDLWDTNIIYLGNGFNLEGYKYLNLEVSSPNCNNYSVNIESWTDLTQTGYEGERKLEFSRILTNEMQVYQIPFGVFKEYWFDWRESENYKKPITDNKISYIYISTQDTEDNWNWHAGVDVYVKSITATNTLLEAPDTSKDKFVYSAIETEGRRITTCDGWAYLDTGYYDLEGYDYLNFEIASSNSGSNVVSVYARDYCNDTVGILESVLPQDYEIIQIPFDKAKGSNGLRSLAIWATEPSTPGGSRVKDVDVYIKKIWATNTKIENDVTKDKVVFNPNNSAAYKFITSDDWKPFYIGNVNLEGYEYLNVELYSPSSGANIITLDGWGNDENVANFNTLLTEDPIVIQCSFGTHYGRWYKDNQKMTNTTDFFDHFNIGAHGIDWKLNKDVEIFIKRIWATNTKLENDTTKDRVVYISPTDEGYKVTTESNWKNLSTGYQKLDGWKYINIELYSPNSEDYDIKIDGWDSERVSVFHSKLSSQPVILQAPFGINRGHWEGEVDGVWNDNIPSTNNDLSGFAIGAHLGDNWDLQSGIDVYIKRIWVTNTELK